MSGFFTRPTEVHSLLTEQGVKDINTISAFLASPSQSFDNVNPENTVYVLIGSAILPTLEAVFDHISQCKEHVTLVLAGGIGHSTILLYEAVARHPRYTAVSHTIQGLPEAQVFRHLLLQFWPTLVHKLNDGTLELLIDDRSTNCGANALETKRELDNHGIRPKRLFIIQDPTMNLRTLATFQKIYEDDFKQTSIPPPDLLPWSFFPKMSLLQGGTVSWEVENQQLKPVEGYELWEPARFISLILGEIPRIRDDEKGYGPKGAGFIAHVDIPDEVEEAWSRLNTALQSGGSEV